MCANILCACANMCEYVQYLICAPKYIILTRNQMTKRFLKTRFRNPSSVSYVLAVDIHNWFVFPVLIFLYILNCLMNPLLLPEEAAVVIRGVVAMTAVVPVSFSSSAWSAASFALASVMSVSSLVTDAVRAVFWAAVQVTLVDSAISLAMASILELSGVKATTEIKLTQWRRVLLRLNTYGNRQEQWM